VVTEEAGKPIRVFRVDSLDRFDNLRMNKMANFGQRECDAEFFLFAQADWKYRIAHPLPLATSLILSVIETPALYRCCDRM
jgi:hypothetical protein